MNQNLRPWANTGEVTKAVEEIATLVEAGPGIPRERLRHYGILAVISDPGYRNLFLEMIGKRCPPAHPQFTVYLRALAENGRRYSREYRAEMHFMMNSLGQLRGMTMAGSSSGSKGGRNGGIAGQPASDGASLNSARSLPAKGNRPSRSSFGLP